MSYSDNDIEIIEDDIEKIKKEHHTYIGFDNWDAVKHLFKEVLQNSVDEAASKESPCDLIISYVNEINKTIRVEDNGRGIPLGMLEKVCIIIQSSGKFNKGSNNAYKYATGTHGVGLTATNALSTKFKITSMRDGKKKTVFFEFGHKVKEKIEDYYGPSGTIVEFTPNEEILKKCNFNYKDIFEICKLMSYHQDILFKCKAITKSGETIKEKYRSKNGIVDLVNEMAPNALMKPVYIKYEENNMLAEVAFTYASDIVGKKDENSKIVSFANFCTTTEGGTHVDGFKQGLTLAMGKYVRENILTKRDKNIVINGDDIKNGLVAVINIMLTNGTYSGQIKAKLQTLEALPFMRTITMKGINKWLKEDTKHSKVIGSFIKDMAKLRIKSSEERKSVLKNNSNYLNGLSKNRPKNWYCENPNKIPIEGRELIIVEGESAGGICKQARNPAFQDIFYLKGVVKNGTNDLNEMLKNDEFKGLVQALGTNVGKAFNPDKCRYVRILIATDADVDGNRITSGVCTWFINFFPELIKRGMIYKIVPPLYKITIGKKNILLKDNKEYAKFIQKQIATKVEIKKGKIVLSKNDVVDLLVRNKNYVDDINKLAKHFIINKELTELIALHIEDNNIKSLEKEILKRFPYLKINEKVIEGVADGEYQFFKLNKKSRKKLHRISMHLVEDEKSDIIYKINNEKVTLYNLLNKLKAYEPKHKQRYKGLGEMNPDAVYECILDPDSRQLIRLTLSKDYDRDVEVFNVLHGKKPKYREERKTLMSKFRISLEDIDS